MMKLTTEQWAKLGIIVQFLALIRILAEYFRLKYEYGAQFSLGVAEPFVIAALLDALLCWLAVALFFFHRYASTLGVAIFTVLVLLIYKFYAIGW
ncbi:MAG: hypothetical protein HYR94_10075 [Chloroflexi bacterium]|nr:hypothetical protein [Chloroflexota bacterium]